MYVFLNDQLVQENSALVSVFDRSFLYGDGLFETARVFNGKPFRWAQHLHRLREGARFLNIQVPLSDDVLSGFVLELISKNQLPDSLLRMTLSRGVGVRGYSPKAAENPLLVMSLHPAPLDFDSPPRWKLLTSSITLPANQPLASFKTCNKLPQIVARAQADEAGADEALLLNSEGAIVEGSSSNLFWMEGDTVCTPPLAAGILPGVTRAAILELSRTLSRATREDSIAPERLRHAEGVFLSLSSIGLAEGASLDSYPLKQTPFLQDLWSAYRGLIREESR